VNIFITGSAGFIGFHTAKLLLNEGHTVVGLDNFNAYYDVQLKEARHAQLEVFENYIGVRGDLYDYPLFLNLFKKYQFDRVCHLAAQAGVRYSIANPFAYQESNLKGFLNILEVCRQYKVKRLVFASSSSVYGGNTTSPSNEADQVDHPLSLYAATKKANELMAHSYTHLYGFQNVGLRFFTVYGPWGRPDMAYWLFTEAMLKNNPIKVFNHGDMQRDFTYIDDVVAGIKAALFADGLAPYEIFNLGKNQPERLMDMITYLSEALGVKPQIKMFPMQAGDLAVTYADIDKAKKILHYEPSVLLKDGLKKFANWFIKFKENKNHYMD